MTNPNQRIQRRIKMLSLEDWEEARDSCKERIEEYYKQIEIEEVAMKSFKKKVLHFKNKIKYIERPELSPINNFHKQE